MAEHENEIISVGLVAGRHDIPVSEYIFPDGIDDVTDFVGMEQIATKFFKKIYSLGSHTEWNSTPDYTDYEISVGDYVVRIYVTGLTAALIAAINAANVFQVRVQIMHFDRNTNTYIPQDLYQDFCG